MSIWTVFSLTIEQDMIVRMEDDQVTVDDLLALPFSTRSLEVREKIVSQGRPVVPLSYATATAFSNLPWLITSTATGRFYCWPCLLFDDKPGDWNKVGLLNLGLVRSGAEEHMGTPAHLQAVFRLQHFDRLEGKRTEPARGMVVASGHHPEAVRRLTDAVCSLATLQRPPDCLKTLVLLRKYDAATKSHSDESIRWFQFTPGLYERVIAAVAKVARRKVAEAVRGSQYVALVLSRHSQTRVSSVLRYVRHGKVEERFLGFAPVPESEGAMAVYEHVRILLREMDVGPKLVALSADAGVVEAGDRDDLLVKLRHEEAPLCRWAPWHSHSPDRILRQCLQRRRPTCRKFFACLRTLEHVFRDRPELCTAAPETEGLRDALSGRANAHFLRYVQCNVPLLVQLFDSAPDDATLKGLGAWLREATTVFLLNVLSQLSGPTAALSAAMRGYVPERQFGVSGSVASSASDLLRELRRLMTNEGAPGWWEDALEGVASEVRARYCDLNRFRFCCLFDFLEEGWFKNSDIYLRHLLACYDLKDANLPRTRAELELLWAHMSFSKTSAYDFHQHLYDSHLRHTFRSMFDFSELVLAMPFKHASLDRETSLWDRIDRWIAPPDPGIPEDVCLLSVESNYLQEIRQLPGFYDEVLALLSG